MWQPDDAAQVAAEQTHPPQDYPAGMQDVADVPLELGSRVPSGFSAQQQQGTGSGKHAEAADGDIQHSQSKLSVASVPDAMPIGGSADQVVRPQFPSQCTDVDTANQQQHPQSFQAAPAEMGVCDHDAAVTSHQLLGLQEHQNSASVLDPPMQSGRSTICQPIKHVNVKGPGAASAMPFQKGKQQVVSSRYSRPLSLSEPEMLPLKPQVPQQAVVAQKCLVTDAATANTQHADPDQVSNQKEPLAAQTEQPLVPYQQRSVKGLSQMQGQHVRPKQAGMSASGRGGEHHGGAAVSSLAQKQGDPMLVYMHAGYALRR